MSLFILDSTSLAVMSQAFKHKPLLLIFFTIHALKKEMTTHSSILAWRIPGTGESVGLPSMGLHGVRHD